MFCIWGLCVGKRGRRRGRGFEGKAGKRSGGGEGRKSEKKEVLSL